MMVGSGVPPVIRNKSALPVINDRSLRTYNVFDSLYKGMAKAGSISALDENERQPSVSHKGRFKNPWPNWKYFGATDLLRWRLRETNHSKVPSEEVTLLRYVHVCFLPFCFQENIILHGSILCVDNG